MDDGGSGCWFGAVGHARDEGPTCFAVCEIEIPISHARVEGPSSSPTPPYVVFFLGLSPTNCCCSNGRASIKLEWHIRTDMYVGIPIWICWAPINLFPNKFHCHLRFLRTQLGNCCTMCRWMCCVHSEMAFTWLKNTYIYIQLPRIGIARVPVGINFLYPHSFLPLLRLHSPTFWKRMVSESDRLYIVNQNWLQLIAINY